MVETESSSGQGDRLAKIIKGKSVPETVSQSIAKKLLPSDATPADLIRKTDEVDQMVKSQGKPVKTK